MAESAESDISDISVCLLCRKLSEDPRILPCAHSFCLKCLESSFVSKDCPKCPHCNVTFKIPEGGYKNMKKNEFLLYLNKLSINERNCDSCDENRSINFCIECSSHYCSACLQHHGRIPSTRSHRLYLKENVTSDICNSYDHQICSDHSEMLNLYCVDCKLFACAMCFATNHKKHDVVHISEKMDKIRNCLDLKIKTKEGDLKIFTENIKSTEKKLNDYRIRAGELKSEIQSRGDDIKELVDAIVAEMSEEVDKELKLHEQKVDDFMTKLKEMQTDLNLQIGSLKQKLINLNCINIVEEPDEKLVIPAYPSDFNMFITTSVIDRKSNLVEMFGFLKKRPELFNSMNFDGFPISFAADKDNIYVNFSYDKSMIYVYDISGFNYKSSFSFETSLRWLNDMEVIDGVLFFSGQVTMNTDYIILKIVISDEEESEVFEMQRIEDASYCWLSKTTNNHLIASLNKRILVLSEDGYILKTIMCPVDVCHSIQVDDSHFVIGGESFVCIINQNGSITSNYAPDNDMNVIEKANYMAMDKHRNIFVCGYNEKKIFVFGQDMNKLVDSFEIGTTPSKICYISCLDALMVLSKDHRRLMMFRL